MSDLKISDADAIRGIYRQHKPVGQHSFANIANVLDLKIEQVAEFAKAVLSPETVRQALRAHDAQKVGTPQKKTGKQAALEQMSPAQSRAYNKGRFYLLQNDR